MRQEEKKHYESATFGGGCFWCTEAIFQRLKGVASVSSGYAGGSKEKPSYEEVCSGTTGHAEVVRILFDPKIITYRDLLEIFFATHDPTTVNRQGNDVGAQYRSAILYENEAQKKAAEKIIKEINEKGAFAKPIVTELAPLEQFYEAEQYHRDYYNANRGQPYCSFVIAPKLEKFKKKFAS